MTGGIGSVALGGGKNFLLSWIESSGIWAIGRERYRGKVEVRYLERLIFFHLNCKKRVGGKCFQNLQKKGKGRLPPWVGRIGRLAFF